MVKQIIFDVFHVAPRRGAWIEMISPIIAVIRANFVAPHRGAWIEIYPEIVNDYNNLVAPRRGAWIEILSLVLRYCSLASRIPQGCVD